MGMRELLSPRHYRRCTCMSTDDGRHGVKAAGQVLAGDPVGGYGINLAELGGSLQRPTDRWAQAAQQ